MGRAKDYKSPKSIFGGNNNLSNNVENSSRLSESSEDFRNSILSRNLYSEIKQYPLQPNDRQRVVNSVSSVLDTIAPFNSKSIDNTVLGRVVSIPSTPLTDIGLIMLSKQFTSNFKNNVIQETFPSINISNLWDKNPNTKLFTNKKNFRITQREDATTFEKFTEKFFGSYQTYNYPFNKNTENYEYLRNTGSAQLSFLFNALNKNFYKTDNPDYIEIGDEIKTPILNITNKVPYYDFLLTENNPYLYLGEFLSPQAIEDANLERYYTVDLNKQLFGQEYAPNIDFIDKLGKTTKIEYTEFNEETGFDEDINNQIVWGRDSVDKRTNERLKNFRGIEENDIAENNRIYEKFNGRIGLLDHTKNLLNASQGNYIDQTKKKFNDFRNKKFIYNGSGLWKAPENSLFNGKTGVRQHTVLDQYDKFSKAIRFDGNTVYNGNENSVINKSVIPRMHPSLNDDNLIDNKNLMFSIENLAVNVIESNDSKYAIIDDEYGTLIPKTEAGPFGGRMLWFPPYIESFNEVAAAKYDTTVMVGRSEPIYTYMNSERSATLTFKMIMDHPENVNNLKTHKEVVDFFAFGGRNLNKSTNTDNPSKKQKENIDKIENIEGKTKRIRPDISIPNSINVYFPNDYPEKVDNYSVIDAMYNDLHYEIIKGLPNKVDVNSENLNGNNVYKLVGLEPIGGGKYDINIPTGFLQSTTEYDENLSSEIDKSIFELFNDENNVDFFKIVIVGKATKLFTPKNPNDIERGSEYNDELGLRRANAVKSFLEQRIKKVLGKSAEALNIIIETTTEGDQNASEENAKTESIPTLSAKQERSATINFETIDVDAENKETNLSSEERKAIDQLKRENEDLQTKVNNKKRNVYDYNIMNERDINDGGVLKSSDSIIKNKLYPAFHSQTPEDFHKRLTFLHQCTRQGSAIRTNPDVDDSGISRVKNSVFGRQPICVLRIGDFFYTKIIIESVTIDYDENIWDTNPEGFGLQPMVASVVLQMKVLGGQSLKGPIDALQNAVSFNYYANSTFSDKGVYKTASNVADKQESYMEGVLNEKSKEGKAEFNKKIKNGFTDNIYGYTEEDILE